MAIKSLLPQGREAWILTGGIAGVVLLGVGLALGPVRNRFVVLHEATVLQEQALARNLAIVTPSAREAVEEDYRRYGALIMKQGSSDEENSAMMSEVDKLAGQNKVILTATKPLKGNKDADSESYAVEVEIESDMPALMGFVCALESSGQLLRVDRLTVDAKGGKNPSALHSTLLVSKVVTLP